MPVSDCEDLRLEAAATQTNGCVGGIGPEAFVSRLYEAAGFWTVMTGLIKAPFFAFVIAQIGCYEGLRVEGSAESVGKLTTRAVVESIFMVIVLDALFSILFNMIGI